MAWPSVSPKPTQSEVSALTSIIKQNQILNMECAAKVSVFITEAEQCID